MNDLVKVANLDFERVERLGMVEAIWGENKSIDQISAILETFKLRGEFALVTRVQSKKAKELLLRFKDGVFHQHACCFTLGSPAKSNLSLGKVTIISGGTSDFKVASEAQIALECHGISTQILMDVGVAGLHRLISNLEKLKSSSVLIACAGMEGALPTVLAGLVPQPVIGVPISVGYGLSSGGKSALNGMLSSCAPGLVVVNIDNGYGAAMAAIRMLKMKLKKH
tara:strand:- start:155 stop:829 length:675 start_codon:yes stop_codon:yes gene_type:complete